MPHSPKQTAVSLFVDSHYIFTEKVNIESNAPQDVNILNADFLNLAGIIRTHTSIMGGRNPSHEGNSLLFLQKKLYLELFVTHYNTDLIGNPTDRTEELKPVRQSGNDENIFVFTALKRSQVVQTGFQSLRRNMSALVMTDFRCSRSQYFHS